jgi:hypothetical protein
MLPPADRTAEHFVVPASLRQENNQLSSLKA